MAVIIAIVIPEIPRVVRLVRAIVLSIREEPYVEAAITVGTPTPNLLVRHVLPNTIAPLIVQGTFICGSAILIEAILSFLGIGIPPETPTWGNIMAEGPLGVSHVSPQHLLSGRVPGVGGARHQHSGRRLARYARPALGQAGVRGMADTAPVLAIKGLSVALPRGSDRPHAVEGINLTVGAGEIVCVVGESGSGKSVTAQAVMGLLPRELGERGPHPAAGRGSARGQAGASCATCAARAWPWCSRSR